MDIQETMEKISSNWDGTGSIEEEMKLLITRGFVPLPLVDEDYSTNNLS